VADVTETPARRAIVYRDVVEFELPIDWKGKFESDGMGQFFDPANPRLTLRLEVRLVKPPPAKPYASVMEVARAVFGRFSSHFEELPHEQVLCIMEPKMGNEGGRVGWLYAYPLLRRFPSGVVRWAQFVAAVEGASQLEQDLAMLDMLKAAIRRARITDRSDQVPGFWKRVLGWRI